MKVKNNVYPPPNHMLELPGIHIWKSSSSSRVGISDDGLLLWCLPQICLLVGNSGVGISEYNRCWPAVMQIRSKQKPKNEQMYYRPDSNPPGAVAWRRTGGQGVWSTEQEVAMLLLQSFVIINISIIISIIMIISTFISTEIIDHHDRCWSHQRAGTAQASTHAQHTTSLGCLDQGRSSLMLNVSWIWI